MIGREARIEEHGDDARADCAPEQDRKLERVEYDECNSVLRLDAESRERRADAGGGIEKLAIGERALGIAYSELLAASLRHVAVQEVDGGVVMLFASHDRDLKTPVQLK